MAEPDKVIIIGGGIGGLAAALSLLKRGIDVEVHEHPPATNVASVCISVPRWNIGPLFRYTSSAVVPV